MNNKITLQELFNKLPIRERYNYVWNQGRHQLTYRDYNRDFLHSIYVINAALYVEIIFNVIDDNIITIIGF